MSVVAEVVVAVGDVSNTRHSSILRIDDFEGAPLELTTGKSPYLGDWERKRFMTNLLRTCLISYSLPPLMSVDYFSILDFTYKRKEVNVAGTRRHTVTQRTNQSYM